MNLSTDRLQLKLISHEDVDFIFDHFRDESVNAYLYDAEPFKSIEEANEIIDFYVKGEPRLQSRWIMITKEGGEKIGTCGFHNWNKSSGLMEIGYDMKKTYWDQGFMTEALEAILSFAKVKMHIKTVNAHIFVGNASSIRLVEKLGFQRKGSYNEVYLGEEYPHWVYSKTLV
jgi:ribosomal-protein-alanine N-acetyltransferase